MVTSFNIFDISGYTDFSNLKELAAFKVQNGLIYQPDGKIFARYFAGVGYITLPEQLDGIWMTQEVVSWEETLISPEHGRGLVLLLSPILSLVKGSQLDFHWPTESDFPKFVEHAKKVGDFYLFSYPDGSVGVRVDAIVNTVKVHGDIPYNYVSVIILTVEKFEKYFQMGITDLAAHNRFKGSRQTFYF